MSRGRRPVLAQQSTGPASAGRRLSSYRGVRRADAPVRRRSRRDGCHRVIRRPAPRERLPLIHGSDARAPPALPPRRGRPGDLGHAARKRTTRLSTPGPAQEARQQAGVRSMLAVWAKAVGRSPQAADARGSSRSAGASPTPARSAGRRRARRRRRARPRSDHPYRTPALRGQDGRPAPEALHGQRSSCGHASELLRCTIRALVQSARPAGKGDGSR